MRLEVFPTSCPGTTRLPERMASHLRCQTHFDWATPAKWVCMPQSVAVTSRKESSSGKLPTTSQMEISKLLEPEGYLNIGRSYGPTPAQEKHFNTRARARGLLLDKGTGASRPWSWENTT